MTSPVPELQQIANPAPAYRMGAMLLGMGTLHFVAPKPFDSIIPAELPGSARFYTYASGVAELGTGALLLAPRTRKLGALAAVALFIGVFPGKRQHGAAVVGQGVAGAARRRSPGCRCRSR